MWRRVCGSNRVLEPKWLANIKVANSTQRMAIWADGQLKLKGKALTLKIRIEKLIDERQVKDSNSE